MKKIMLAMLMATFLIGNVMAYGAVTKINLIGNNSIYTEQKFTPLIFLNNQGGRLIYDDPYGFFTNGNASVRTNNYIFTGEQIEWKFLVWDKNGVPEKINDIFAGWADQTNGPIAPNMQVNCQYLRAIPASNLANLGYPNVRRPGDQEPQVNGNPDTMGEYVCRLTVEPSCHGQKWFGVKAVDLDNLESTMVEAESWFCNPILDLTFSGNINFGTLGPGEQGTSTFSVTNNAEAGSGVNVILSISGKDFYDPSSSGGMCPTSNVLKLQGVNPSVFSTGFWYTATQGSNSVGNKRIPYSDGSSIASSDPIFSSGNGLSPNWSNPVTMTPGSDTSITLHLGIPSPCNGQFTDGTINLWALAI